MSELWEPNSSASMSSVGDSHASRPAAQQPLLADVWAWLEATADSGGTCAASFVSFNRESPSWRTPIQSGLPRCREIWRALATEYPDGPSRLRVLVIRIFAGACSWLPT